MIRHAVFLSLLAATAAPAQQPARPPVMAAPAPLDAAARQDVVAKLGTALRDQYVFSDIGGHAAAAISAALASGRYDALTDATAFSARLSADVAAIAHDKHLRVRGPSTPPPGADRGPPPRGEAGLFRADKLAGGVGYLEVLGFPPPPLFKPVLDRAMAPLAGSRALIVDVRRNGGGSPEAVAYLVSYFVKPGRPINDIVSRTEGTRTETRQSYHAIATPVSFAGIPVYVLTSANTFSGGEEFAYDVQALKAGLVVGEVTGGGANPTGGVDLGHGMEASVPFGRAENPVTNANWEGKGVQPDLRIPAAGALGAALARAGQPAVNEVAAASREQVFAPRSTPRPGSEAALRSIVAGYAGGAIDESIVAPNVAAEARAHADELKAQFASLGALQSVTFHGPDPIGGDEFVLRFANGARMMALVLGLAGKVAGVSTAIPVRP